MEGFMALLAALLSVLAITVDGQISTPCTTSMIAGFTPCVNYLMGSSGNGAPPTASCCDTIESLMTMSMECTCLIVTGNVPFSLPSPINQALAGSLLRACNSTSAPLRCKASGAPLPPPGPALFNPPPPRPLLPPTADSPEFPPSPSASETAAMAPTPAEMSLGISPEGETEASDASPPVSRPYPSATSGIRPVLTPASASNPLLIPSSPLLLLVVLVAVGVTNFF